MFFDYRAHDAAERTKAIRDELDVDALTFKLLRAQIKASDELIGDLCGVLHELVDDWEAGVHENGWGVDECSYCLNWTAEGHPAHCPISRARQMLRDIETPTDDAPTPPASEGASA